MKFIIVMIALMFVGTASANVTGTHLQNFNPTTNGLDFVTVHSSKTLDPGILNLGLFGNYAVNSLPFFKFPGIPNTQNFSEPNDKLLSSDVLFGLGLSQGWDVGIALPFVLDQDIKRSAQLGAFDEKGLTEIRLNTKVRMINEENYGLAAIASVNFDRIKNNPFTGNDSGPTWNLELAWDYKISPIVLWAVNVGYRYRDAGEIIADTGVQPLSDQLIYSTAISYFYESWNTTFIGELFGGAQTENTYLPTDRDMSSLEILLGAKHQFTERITGHAGVSTETYHGLATPDLRLYAGLHWQVGAPKLAPPPPPPHPPAPAPPPPAPVQEVVTEDIVETEPPSQVIVLSAINFDTGSDQMTAKSKADFQNTIQQIKDAAHLGSLRRIIVEGHTDHIGKADYNQKLSQRRAASVQHELQGGGLGEKVRIDAKGFGETRPVASNDSAKGRAKNRRVELKIYRNQ